LTVDEYFGMIINILMGLTFIVLVLIFFYMIYGEKEEEQSSSIRRLAIKIYQRLSMSLIIFFNLSF